MDILEKYEKVEYLIDKIQVDKVYPCSIIEGIQSGEVIVDDVENPKCALFWHYSGFGYIAGEFDESFITRIISSIHSSKDKHSGRMALQIGDDEALASLMKEYRIEKKEQYLFEYVEHVENTVELDAGFIIEKINVTNYDLLSGRITPSFSWENKKQFLEHGYGYCILHENEFVACAFSAGISKEYVDIGVETLEKYRGKGYGKFVCLYMIEEIRRRKQIPIWECNTTNEASKRLACSVGFQIRGVHPLYVM